MSAVVQNSVILCQLNRLLQLLALLVRDSFLCKSLSRAGAALAYLGRSSAFCRGLCGEGPIPRCYEGSLFYRILDGLFHVIPSLWRASVQRRRALWEGSLAFRIAAFLGSKMEWLLGLVFFVMLVAPHQMWDNTYGFAAMVLLMIFFLAAMAAGRTRRLEVRAMGPYYALFGLMILLGFVGSNSLSLSLRFLLFHLTCLLVVLLVLSSADSWAKLRRMMIFVAVGAVAASLYGCYQGYVGVEVIASQQDLSLNEGMPGRIYSFFDNPNNFAEILVMVIPLFLALFCNARGWRGKVWSLVGLVPCLVAIAMTYSRSGWIGLALAVIIFLGFKNWRFIPLIIVIALAALPFLPSTIYNRIFTIGNMEDSSTQYRFAIYESIWRLLRDRWVAGVGLGSDVVKEALKAYPTMFDGNYAIHSHNNYLQVWSEMGVFGLLAFLGTVGYQLKRGFQAVLGKHCDKQLKNVIAAGVAGFSGILVISIAEYTWFYPRNLFLFWFLFALIGAAVKLALRQAAERRAADN